MKKIKKCLSFGATLASFFGVFIALLENPVKWYCKLVTILLIFIAFSISYFIYLNRKKCFTLYEQGKVKINALYSDLLKVKKNKKNEKPVVLIPVNTSFDTIVENSLNVKDPIISPKSIHGQWIQSILNDKYTIDLLDKEILDSLVQNYKPIKTLNKRGKTEFYEMGSHAFIEKEEVTYLLFAISEFDSNNHVITKTKNELMNLMHKLISIINSCQGRDIYIPIIGTGLSNFGLDSTGAFDLIKSVLIGNATILRSSVTIVIKEDEDNINLY